VRCVVGGRWCTSIPELKSEEMIGATRRGVLSIDVKLEVLVGLHLVYFPAPGCQLTHNAKIHKRATLHSTQSPAPAQPSHHRSITASTTSSPTARLQPQPPPTPANHMARHTATHAAITSADDTLVVGSGARARYLCVCRPGA